MLLIKFLDLNPPHASQLGKFYTSFFMLSTKLSSSLLMKYIETALNFEFGQIFLQNFRQILRKKLSDFGQIFLIF